MKKIFVILAAVLGVLPVIGAKNADAQKLVQLLQDAQRREEITPDSIYYNIQLLEDLAGNGEDSMPRTLIYRATTAMLYAMRADLAQTYSRNTASHPDSIRQWSRQEWYQHSAQVFHHVLAHKDVLAEEKAQNWIPLVQKGRNHNIYTGDMLSVVWIAMENCLPRQFWDSDSVMNVAAMSHFYLQRNNLQGALELELNHNYNGVSNTYGQYLQNLKARFDSIATEYKDKALKKSLPYRNLLAMIENDSIAMRQPVLSIRTMQVSYPGDSIPVVIKSQNVSRVMMSLYLLPQNFDDSDEDLTRRVLKQGKLIETTDWCVPAASSLSVRTDTLMLPGVSQNGRYAIVFDGETGMRLTRRSEKATRLFCVSRMMLATQALPNQRSRIIINDARTGEPRSGVSVWLQRRNEDGIWNTFCTMQTDARGICESSIMDNNQFRIVARYEDDIYSPEINAATYYAFWGNSNNSRTTRLFCDRSIYRPGQKLMVTGIVYDSKQWNSTACPDLKISLELIDNNRKTVGTQDVVTDEMGTFSTSFTIPEDAPLGTWTITSNGSRLRFKVEEYKRPTFYIRLEQDQMQKDSLSNRVTSVTISGVALNYNGTPVGGARVTAQMSRMSCLWYNGGNASYGITTLDTVYTDAQGRFTYQIAVDTTSHNSLRFYPHVLVKASVLSASGETESSEVSVRLFPDPEKEPEKKKWLECPVDTFCQQNPAVVELRLDASEQRPKWVYLMGFSGNRIVIDSVICLKDTLMTIQIPYRQEYGDGILLSVMSVQNNTFLNGRHNLYLQLPDNRLRLHWDTFRDHTQPGGHEQWTLRVQNPDSSNAQANVMLRMYDASLDALWKQPWNFDISRMHRIPTAAFNFSMQWNLFYNWTEQIFNTWNPTIRTIDLSRIDTELFQKKYDTAVTMFAKPMYAMANGNKTLREVAVRGKTLTETAVNEELQGRIAGLDIVESLGGIDSNELRQDFSETAIFMPQLRTDANGRVSISFDMPQSLTTWHLEGIAHTRDMNIATLDETIVAQKALMAELVLPRFVREGDRINFGVKVSSLNADVLQKGKLTVEIASSENPQKVLKRLQMKFALDGIKDSTYILNYDVPEGMKGVCVKVLARGTEDSDGEMREIPVLSSEIELTDSRALTLEGGQSETVDASQMFPADSRNRMLIVERTTNPAATAVNALEALLTPSNNDALSWASAYYACTLLGQENRMPYINRVRQMQNADGSISWYPGLPGNTVMTRRIAMMLLRLPHVEGEAQIIAERVTEDARRFLLKEAEKSIALRQKNNKDWTATLEDLQFVYIMTRGYQYSPAQEVVKNILQRIPADITGMSNEYMALAMIVAGNHTADETLRRRLSHPDGYYIAYPGGNRNSIDYRLHTHTMIMEALSNDNTIINGMQKWLLNQKRTQGWKNAMNTVDAVWALSGFQLENIRDIQSEGNVSRRDTIDASQRAVTISNTSKHVMWAAVYAQYTIPASHVQQSGTDMSIEVSCPQIQSARVGDVVTVRTVLTLHRDYEFLKMTLPHGANTESTVRLSGCGWKDGMPFYREIHDSHATYYFPSLPRGTYILEEDQMVMRMGQYNTGVAQIECLYAPEFRAHTD